jgi:hypothetical protein
MPAPAIVDKALFDAAQGQLRENRTRARLGPRRPGHLLQGLTGGLLGQGVCSMLFPRWCADLGW